MGRKPRLTGKRDASDRLPLYVRVAASLRARISAGEWKEGDKLPAFNFLAPEYGVATITMRTAIGLLRDEGLVSSSRGRGTIVEARARVAPYEELRHIINSSQKLPEYHSIRVLSRRAVKGPPKAISETYKPVEDYMHLSKVHLFKDEPYAFVNIYVARKIYDRFPRNSDQYSYITHLLRDLGKAEISASRHEITITHADPHVSQLLQAPLAAQLVCVRRWRLDRSKKLIYASAVLYRPEFFVWDVTDSARGFDPFRLEIDRKRKKRAASH